DAVVEALAQYCTARPVSILIFSQNFESRLVAPRVAARLDGSDGRAGSIARGPVGHRSWDGRGGLPVV
ncbi:MAG: hypothetical protein M1272_05315, partial [Firmicutes bacterium]|nr:hypothetical protein [Bacillota bacterium]